MKQPKLLYFPTEITGRYIIVVILLACIQSFGRPLVTCDDLKRDMYYGNVRLK